MDGGLDWRGQDWEMRNILPRMIQQMKSEATHDISGGVLGVRHRAQMDSHPEEGASVSAKGTLLAQIEGFPALSETELTPPTERHRKLHGTLHWPWAELHN